MTLITRLTETARRRARYRRTLAELRTMSIDTALDLDLHPGDYRRIAREAVYG